MNLKINPSEQKFKPQNQIRSFRSFFLRLNNYLMITKDVNYSEQNTSLNLFLANEKNYLSLYLSQNSQKIKNYFEKVVSKYNLQKFFGYNTAALSVGLIGVGGLGSIGLELLNYFKILDNSFFKPLEYYFAFGAVSGFILLSFSARLLGKAYSYMEKRGQEFKNIKEFISLLDEGSKSLNIKEIESIQIQQNVFKINS